jgi:predicted small metal-binding protein
MTAAAIRSLRCACGWEATGTFEELVVAAGEHGRRIHNMMPTRDEVAAMLLPTGPAEPAAHRAQLDDGDVPPV